MEPCGLLFKKKKNLLFIWFDPLSNENSQKNSRERNQNNKYHNEKSCSCLCQTLENLVLFNPNGQIHQCTLCIFTDNHTTWFLVLKIHNLHSSSSPFSSLSLSFLPFLLPFLSETERNFSKLVNKIWV